MLSLRFLGDVEVAQDDRRLALPPSKKTRALLAYLALTGRPVRRERLCALLWDVPDDPRGALRWSLSKLRPLLDEPGRPRLIADRESVRLDAEDSYVDLRAARQRLAGGIDSLETEALEAIAGEFRGELLEGLDLPRCPEFQAWCIGEREEARLLLARVLAALLQRHDAAPATALAHAQRLARIDPYAVAAHAAVLRHLAVLHRHADATAYLQSARRLLAEVDAEGPARLDAAWAALRANAPSPSAHPAPAAAPASPAGRTVALVGRDRERQCLADTLAAVRDGREGRVILLSGEPGIGKSRLLADLVAAVAAGGGLALEGAAFESEADRPFGPWIDALQRLPPAGIGPDIAAALMPLMPALGRGADGAGSRDRLFGAVAELIAARASATAPVLIAFDDIHWCDEPSAALLHYIVRLNRHRPVLVALAAREGEIPDNAAVQRLLRTLRNEGALVEVTLRRLGADDIRALVAGFGDAARSPDVFAESGGNPLFAIELARARHDGAGHLPPTIKDAVRARIERLPPLARDVLRWAAVQGRRFDPDRLSALGPFPLDELLEALETLERHDLIAAAEDEHGAPPAYAFAHDVVRRVVYAAMSEPRRRLMHRRIAESLSAAAAADETLAPDLAHHAALGGDAAMAARACVEAGRRCLRLFANAEAEAMVRRGRRFAESLREPERCKLTLELLNVQLAARRPDDVATWADEIAALADRAVDHGAVEHARLGFHMLSWLRWDRGEWTDARRHTMQAELITRGAGEGERVVALAEAARCLALLERDLGDAEALLREATALSRRTGVETTAIPHATAMMHLHRGEIAQAVALLEETRALTRRDGDHLSEFQVLEHLFLCHWRTGDHAAAAAVAADAGEIAGRLRDGSEQPFAAALAALARYALDGNGETSGTAMDAAVAALRQADAKYRLCFALSRAAALDLQRGFAARGAARAGDALALAETLNRPSDTAFALVLRARAAAALGRTAELQRALAALKAIPLRVVAEEARVAAEAALAEHGSPRRSTARK